MQTPAEILPIALFRASPGRSLAILITVLLAVPMAAQTVPTTLNYQGRLTDNTPSQTPVSATVQMQFAIYDAASGGTRLWQEPAADNTGTAVTVTTGIFNYVLGNTVAIPASVFSGATSVRYLQITLDPAGSAEILTPRQLISATGYANLAENAGDSAELGGVAPAGWQARVIGTCSAGSSIRQVNADGTVVCQADTAGPAYTAGSGLILSGSQFSVDFSGTGSAVTAARSDHTHPAPLRLTVVPTGSGGGMVTSSPAGINCGSTCFADYTLNTVVQLTASPDATSTFAGWSGACTGTGACNVTMDAAKNVSATFIRLQYTLTISRTAGGTVTSDPAGIYCGASCSAVLAAGTTVVLTATPEAGATFAGWGGACSGTGTCVVSMTSAKTVNALFSASLTVQKIGSGAGTVTSAPAGISCGATCSAFFSGGMLVTLTATPDASSSFAGWSGACSGVGVCNLTLDKASTAAANFAGPFAGDVTGTPSATVVAMVGGQTAANIAAGTQLANAATNENSASTIVKRDAAGNFAAGTITAALSGNATSATSAAGFSGTLTGDVTGTQAATVVGRIQGTPVSATFPTANQILQYNGTNWQPAALVETDPKVGTLTSGRVPRWNGATLADGAIHDTGTQLGVGTTSPITQLHVARGTPAAVGSVATGTGPSSVYVQGRYAYTANSTASTLQVFDVSNPAAPVAVGSVATGAGPNSVYVQGRYAYTANQSASTLQVFDVSNPAAPVAVGSVATGANSYSVYVQGRYAYTANSTASTLQVFDVSNPAAPVAVGLVATGTEPSSVYVQGRYAYTTNYTANTLQVFDVSNPAAPVAVGSVATGAGSISVYVQGRYAYTANDTASTLQVFDVSNPAAPVAVGSVATGVGPSSVYVQGRYAYTANSTASTLQVFDVSNPAAPVAVGSVATGAFPRSVFVQGRYAFTANYIANTLQVFDLGGAYVQQLEAGGIETGTLATRGNAQINGDAQIKGGLVVGSGGIYSAGAVAAASFSGNLSGNATGFTGSLAGDVTGTQPATVIATVGGQTASNVAAGTQLANSATDANTASAIVKRDASGNFAASTITGTLSGNAATATTATALAANGANCTAGSYPLGVDASGAVESCTAAGGVTGVTASAPLASSGGATPDISLTGIVGVAQGGTGTATPATSASYQSRVSGTCAAGNSIRVIGIDGTVTCEPDDGATYTAGPGLVLTANQFSLSGLTAPSPPHTEGNRDSGSNDIMGGAMTIGADALGLIAFRDLASQDLKVGHCANTNCTAFNPSFASRVDGSANNVGYYASIAIGTDGFGLVAYQDNTNGDLKVAHCGDTNCTAAAATLTRVDGDGTTGPAVFLGFYPSIAIGADGFGVIAHYDSALQDLRVTHCSNTNCTAATSFSVDTAGDVGIYPSLTIGTDGLPLISYQDTTNNNLKVVHCGNAACTAANTISLVDGAATNVGPNTHITIGSDGFGVMTYTDTLPTTNVKIAHCQNVLCNGAWNVTTIGAAVGGNTSIAIGDDGMAVFTYLDTFSSIRVGHCGNVLCTSATTSALGVANGNASITIGSDRLPLVARVGPLNVLTVTHCSSPFCVPNTRRR